MKQIAVLISIFILHACADKNEKLAMEENLVKDELVSANQEAYSQSVESSIPSYSFEEFAPLLTKKNDTTYVINFWATWCRPCIKEMPYFEEINKKYSKEKVKVILVSLDFPDKLVSHVEPFVESRKISSEVILLADPDVNSWIPKVDKSWSGAIPATIIYNKDKRKFYEQSFSYDELETELKSIL